MKRLLVDVDGVVADFLSSTLAAIKQETGRIVTVDDVVEWDVFKLLTDEGKKKVIKRHLNQPNFALYMPEYPDAVRAINRLSGLLDIVFVTSDWLSSKTWAHDRNEWLVRHFGREQGRRVIHTAHKECVVGDFFIDDKIDNVLLWSDHHPEGTSFLWKHKYNEGFPGQVGVIHTNDWGVVEEACTEI